MLFGSSHLQLLLLRGDLLVDHLEVLRFLAQPPLGDCLNGCGRDLFPSDVGHPNWSRVSDQLVIIEGTTFIMWSQDLIIMLWGSPHPPRRIL